MKFSHASYELLVALTALSSLGLSDAWAGKEKWDAVRDAIRKQIIESAPAAGDRADRLFSRLRYNTLESIERDQLLSARLPEQPWSGDYWPIYEGSMARRYSDPEFPGSTDWKENADYLENKLSAPGSSSVDLLSPAEKYDLLLGDEQSGLTRSMLAEGKSYYDVEGKVESWMGYCHGWAPASYRVPRPAKAVDVLGADGKTKIRFFPADLKALATLLWAKAHFATRFVGLRCDDRDPALDPAGRPINPACRDNNPATWHLSVVNGIGAYQKSFVIDATWDYQVWNQPVYAYSYGYFNPKTGAQAADLASARVRLSDFPHDKYKDSRSPTAVSVVGIAMDLTYMAETSPAADPTDSPDRDRKVTVHYVYDLELDPSGKIVGGEWHQNLHPDFIWTPEDDAVARSTGDEDLDRVGDMAAWDGTDAMPASWKTAGVRASGNAEPLARVVNALSALSALP